MEWCRREDTFRIHPVYLTLRKTSLHGEKSCEALSLAGAVKASYASMNDSLRFAVDPQPGATQNYPMNFRQCV